MPKNAFGRYDDLQVSISTAKVPASSAPTWRTYDFGLGGVAFAVLGFAVGDYLDFYIQTSHSMELNTVLDNHIHYTLPSDVASNYIKFQLDVISAGVDEDFAIPSGSPFTAEVQLAGNEAGRHNLMELADIPAVNTTVSTVYLCRLTRIASTATSYPNEVYVIFDDSHYIKDDNGSISEYSKT